MIELFNTGAYLLNGTELVKDDADAQKVLASKNINVTKEEAAKNTCLWYFRGSQYKWKYGQS